MAIFTSIDTKEIFVNNPMLCERCRRICLDVCDQLYNFENINKKKVDLDLPDHEFENDFEQTVLFTVMHHIWPDYRFKIENQHLIRIK